MAKAMAALMDGLRVDVTGGDDSSDRPASTLKPDKFHVDQDLLQRAVTAIQAPSARTLDVAFVTAAFVALATSKRPAGSSSAKGDEVRGMLCLFGFLLLLVAIGHNN